MTIHIEDLNFKCIIGLLPLERQVPQEVIVNLEIEYNYKEDFINYADVAHLIEEHLIEKKYELLEDALENLCSLISTQFPLTKRLHLKLTKPDILPQCRVSVSIIKIY